MTAAPAHRAPRWREPVLVLLGYSIFAVLFCLPLAFQFGDHIPGVDGDVWSYLWALGWARTSLELGVNPFHSDFVFYPLGGATQLLWGTALPSFASLPLQYAFGLVPAFNLAYLLSTILTGFGAYLLVKSELAYASAEPISPSVRFAAAFIGGIVFAFGALRLGYGLAFINLFHTEFIPFYILLLLRAARRSSLRLGLLAGLFFALNVYIDFQIAAFLAVFTALWLVYWLVCRVRQPATSSVSPVRAAASSWLAIGLTACVLSLPMLVLVLQDFAIEGGNYLRVYPLAYSAERSYDLVSYVLPNARSTLYQALPLARVEGVNTSITTPELSELSPDRQAFLGFTVLALAVFGAFAFRRKVLFWVIAALVFAALSLGPVLHISGTTTDFPLPFALANQVPILNHIRIPMRYGILVLLCSAVLASFGALGLARWRPWTLIPLTLLILLEAVVLPYPTLEFRVPPVYDTIAQDPADATVLEIPSFYWRDAAQNETYQVVHGKRLLRAYTNRIAPDLADYFNLRQTPIVVRSLRLLEGAEEGVLTEMELTEDREVAADTTSFFNLRYAVVHTDQLTPEQVTAIDDYLRDVLAAEPLANDETTRAYRIPPIHTETISRSLELASNTSLMYLGRGWQTEPLAERQGNRGRFVRGAFSEIFAPRGTDTGPALLRVDMPTDANGESAEPGTTTFVPEGAPAVRVPLPAGVADLYIPLAPVVDPVRILWQHGILSDDFLFASDLEVP